MRAQTLYHRATHNKRPIGALRVKQRLQQDPDCETHGSLRCQPRIIRVQAAVRDTLVVQSGKLSYITVIMMNCRTLYHRVSGCLDPKL